MDKDNDRLESFREKREEAQKNSVELTRQVEKVQENLAKMKEEAEQADLRVAETRAELKTSMESEAAARNEAARAKETLKTTISQSEEMIKQANKAKARAEQASKKFETLKVKLENNPGDEKTVKALEQARHDFEEAEKVSLKAAKEAEQAKENMTRAKDELEQADMRVTKATALVKNLADAEIASIKEVAHAKDRLKTATRQCEETIKLANKAKTEEEQANKRLESQKIKTEKKNARDAGDKGKGEVTETIKIEEEKIIDNELYQGKVKIRIDRPATGSLIRELEDSLTRDTDLTVRSIGGSIEEGAYVFVQVDQPSPLEKLLGELPVIERILTDKKNIYIKLKIA